jgi:hypothetical protein
MTKSDGLLGLLPIYYRGFFKRGKTKRIKPFAPNFSASENPRVPGSIPGLGTNISDELTLIVAIGHLFH